MISHRSTSVTLINNETHKLPQNRGAIKNGLSSDAETLREHRKAETPLKFRPL